MGFPTQVDVCVQDQFEGKTTVIRIGSGMEIRLWTKDVAPFLAMLSEVAERSLRIAVDQ